MTEPADHPLLEEPGSKTKPVKRRATSAKPPVAPKPRAVKAVKAADAGNEVEKPERTTAKKKTAVVVAVPAPAPAGEPEAVKARTPKSPARKSAARAAAPAVVEEEEDASGPGDRAPDAGAGAGSHGTQARSGCTAAQECPQAEDRRPSWGSGSGGRVEPFPPSPCARCGAGSTGARERSSAAIKRYSGARRGSAASGTGTRSQVPGLHSAAHRQADGGTRTNGSDRGARRCGAGGGAGSGRGG